MPIKRVWAPHIDFSVLRRELGLPDAFPPEALREAEESARTTPLPPADLTDIPFVTIDPPASKDLDQAMCLGRRPGGGYRVRYAIADVAAFVAPGGALEAETWVRGQTVYLPDGRVPLHPPVLSEDTVSLLPDGDRAAVVWTIDLDPDGATVAVALERGRVRSRAKLDYAGVQAAADAGRLPEPIDLLPELGELLARQAAGRGAVNLPLPEQEVEQTGDGWRLVLRAPLPAEEHNAQISLLTGMAAANLMLAGGIGLLRTMPAPRPEAVATLQAAAGSLGIAWPDRASVGAVVAAVDPASPRGAAFLEQAADLLRGAAYTAFDGVPPAETGHGGVGAPYAHVTAPLRRLATGTRPRSAWPCTRAARSPTGCAKRCPGCRRRWPTRTGSRPPPTGVRSRWPRPCCWSTGSARSSRLVCSTWTPRRSPGRGGRRAAPSRSTSRPCAPGAWGSCRWVTRIAVRLKVADPRARDVQFERD